MLRSKDVEQAVRDLARAITEGDTAAVDHLLSTGDCRVIGSDPAEWWGPDRHEVVTRFQAQVEELAGNLRFEAGSPEGYADNNIGWVADRPTAHLADGSVQPMRLSGVLHREGHAWRFTQLHLSVGVTNEDAIGMELPT